MRAADLFADAVVPQLVDAVVDRLDLTDLVLERVDLRAVISSIDIDEIVGRVDVTAIVDGLDIDAVAARVDVQKIVDRLDLVAIAQGVVDELDLRDHPGIDRDDGSGNGRWRSGPEHARGPLRCPRRRSGAPPSRRGGQRVTRPVRPDRPCGGRVLILPTPDAREVQGHPAGSVSRLLAAIIDLAITVGAMLLFYLGIGAVAFVFRPRAFRWPDPGAITSAEPGGSSWSCTSRSPGPPAAERSARR